MKKVSTILCIVLVISMLAVPAFADWSVTLNPNGNPPNGSITENVYSKGAILSTNGGATASLYLQVGAEYDATNAGNIVSVMNLSYAFRKHTATTTKIATLTMIEPD